jgi:cytochrome P450
VPVPSELLSRITNPRAYADGSIYETYRWLRRNDPCARIEAAGYDPFRVVTRHADIMEISRQNSLFHNAPQPVLASHVEIARSREMNGGSDEPIVKSLIHMDPPEHQRFRLLTQSWFQPKNLKRLEEDLRALARASVDKMAATGGHCDFVNEIALHYPLHVIMNILGVPVEDEPMMLKLTQEMFGATDPDLASASGEEGPKIDMMAAMQMMQYFTELTEKLRNNPTDNLASIIANARINGEPISDLTTMGYYFIIATAGHDTTSSSTAGALWALAENPDEFRKLKDNPALIPQMIEEAVRWVTPVKHFMRTVTEDTSIAGQTLQRGEWLMLCYASGNRDESVFEDPDEFRIDRKQQQHVGFGYGGHLCLGQYLAKMEMRILYEELIPRLDWVELDGNNAAMSSAIFVNGPKRLPIRFGMR